MITGLTSVLIVFLIMSVGYICTEKSWLPDSTNKVFSAVVVKIAAPALAIVSIENRFTPDLLREAALNLVVIAISMMLLHLLGRLLAKILHLTKKKEAVFVTTLTFNNSMFIGLPIISIVFGQEGLPFLFTFYLVTIVLFWSLGAFTLSSASEQDSAKFSVKKIFSPGLVGVMIGCVLAETGWRLPVILETALTYLGDICVPMSLMVIGANLQKSLKAGRIHITGDQVIIMVGKFLLHPLLIWGLFALTGVTGFPLKVFIMAAALPCHAQTAIVAEHYDVEGKYASNLVSLSTLISLIVIPVYAGILL